jgi:hypothetical protein
MAIAVLLLWVLTAGAGLRLLLTSGLGRGPAPSPAPPAAIPAPPAAIPAPPAAIPAPPAAIPAPPAAIPTPPRAMSEREARRAARAQWDPPTLVRARNAPAPGLRDLMEFAHPACGIIGLAFWLGYALVHNRALAWIAFGLAAVTACAGLAWFTANTRAARRRADGEPGPSFSARLVVVHGGAAALTFALVALTALTARR